MVRVSGLWRNKTKDGSTYLKGNLSPVASILVFPNDRKKSDKDPDYYAYFDENKPKDGESNDVKKAVANDL